MRLPTTVPAFVLAVLLALRAGAASCAVNPALPTRPRRPQPRLVRLPITVPANVLAVLPALRAGAASCAVNPALPTRPLQRPPTRQRPQPRQPQPPPPPCRRAITSSIRRFQDGKKGRIVTVENVQMEASATVEANARIAGIHNANINQASVCRVQWISLDLPMKRCGSMSAQIF